MSLVLSELPYAIDALAEHGMSKETICLLYTSDAADE